MQVWGGVRRGLGVGIGLALLAFGAIPVHSAPRGSAPRLVPDEDLPPRPPVAQLRIDGRDVDAPPPETLRVPAHVGLALWAAVGSTSLQTTDGGVPPTNTKFDDVSGAAVSLFGRAGAYSAQLDLLTIDQTAQQAFSLGGGVLGTGANLAATDIVVRLWRELRRYETVHGRFRLDGGLRATKANRTADLAGFEGTESAMYYSPELVLSGRWIMAEDSAIHGRLSYADNFNESKKDSALEIALFLNYHMFDTGTQWYDLQIGVKALDRVVGLVDPLTGRISEFTTAHLGPEVSLACRF